MVNLYTIIKNNKELDESNYISNLILAIRKNEDLEVQPSITKQTIFFPCRAVKKANFLILSPVSPNFIKKFVYNIQVYKLKMYINLVV